MILVVAATLIVVATLTVIKTQTIRSNLMQKLTVDFGGLNIK